jgi:hypothetical protein
MLSRTHLATIGALLCFAAGAAWLVGTSSQRPVLPSRDGTQQQNAKHATNTENQPNKLDWKNWTNDPIAVFTGLLTLFNGLLFVSTVALWKVTRKSADAAEASARIAKDALIATERAFVFLDELIPEFAIRPRGGNQHEFTRLVYKPRWRNSGSTPTKNMTLATNWARLDVGSEMGIGSYDGPNAHSQRMFLGPQAIEWSEAIKIRLPEATLALQGNGFIVVWGRVDYGDIFPGTRPHFTEWCYRINMSFEAGRLHSQPVTFSSYNRSDEDASAG